MASVLEALSYLLIFLIVGGVRVRAFARMPTSQNRDMGHPILWVGLKPRPPALRLKGRVGVGHPTGIPPPYRKCVKV
jgi:hypothetical protein